MIYEITFRLEMSFDALTKNYKNLKSTLNF